MTLCPTLANGLPDNGLSYQWVIEGDIASYFDAIPHRRLMKAIKKRVADRDIRDLIWKFLRAGVIYNGKCATKPYRHTTRGNREPLAGQHIPP